MFSCPPKSPPAGLGLLGILVLVVPRDASAVLPWLGKNFVSLMVDELLGWEVVAEAYESLPDTTFAQLDASPERSALDADLVLEGDMRFTSGSESILLISTPTFRRGEDAGGAPTLRSSICKSLSTFALGENSRVGSGSGGIGLLVTCGTLVPSSMG